MFVVGDVITPKEDLYALTIGKHYKVLGVEELGNDPEGWFPVIINDRGEEEAAYFAYRFKLVSNNMHIIDGE